MTPIDLTYPFCAVVGQDLLKRALLMNAVCPALGGVLIAGDRGTAKTTTARALAALLPALAIVPGCPFRCDPASIWPGCPHCRELKEQETDRIPTPFVELPIGATEDRVAGSLDIERSLREGKPVFRAGLLAAAHRGLLYIDEVNLLADHLVDLLLDAAASGSHSVEREGIAIRHPARFIFVGSMNPEEGELRPQLSDRFALRVNVHTPATPAERAEVIRRRLDFDADPDRFCAVWENEQRQLSAALSAARNSFPMVQLTDSQIVEIAELCTRENIEGLRADLALGRGARALAALAGRQQTTSEDLQAAAELVIPHRTRKRSTTAPRNEENQGRSWFGKDQEGEDESEPTQEPGSQTPGADEHVATPASDSLAPRLGRPAENPKANAAPGRRVPLPAESTGRYIRAVRTQSEGTVAMDATLRASILRGESSTGRLAVRPEDLRWKQQEERRGALVIFVVDASGSMGARRRMEAVKGVALGLLAEAGRLRDDVSVIAVRGPRAEYLLPPTPDAGVAEQALARLPTGGRTPLAHGLTLAADLIQDTNRPVLLVVVGDGKANVALPGTDGDPWAQTLAASARICQRKTGCIVIDAQEGLVQSDRVRELAAALGSECLPLAALSTGGISELSRVACTKRSGEDA
jgi:magnesium chelatase subunit D